MRGLIGWFIDSPVAANLLLLFVAAAGLLTLFGLKQEVFPDAAPDMITVTVVHPGATPEEIEEGVCIKIEEELEGLEGVKRISSTAGENFGIVTLELHGDADKPGVLDDVKTKVDAISTFPEDADRPVIVDVELPSVVLSVIVSGKMDPVTLRRMTQEIRDELAALDEVSNVSIVGSPDYEISIEVSEEVLRRYGLSFDDVVRAVRQNSLNLSGGTVKTRGGEILLRADTQAYVARDFENILLLRSPNGTRVTVGDVGTVVDEFEDVDRLTTFNGDPALRITVFRTDEQSAPEVAEAVFAYLDEKRPELPEGVSLEIGKDWYELLKQRRSLMLENGKWGLILIFALLALFLRLRLAFWVALGIPIALLGAVWLLPAAGTTINMMSLFGFIVVLGILVDDAIVVGENIYYHSRLGKSGKQAAKDGTSEVMVPVILAVMTTIAAFAPMLGLPGWMGKFARVIPVVVICALIFSLVESLLILPRHLAHLKPPDPDRRKPLPLRVWDAVMGSFSRGLEWWVEHVYRPVLGLTMRWRYLTLACGVAVLVLAGAVLKGGIVKFVFFPPIEGDQVVATVTMPEGTPVPKTEAALAKISEAAEVLRQKYEGDDPGSVFEHVLVSLGSQPTAAEHPGRMAMGPPAGSNLGEVFVQLRSPEERGGLKAEDLMRELRALVGEIPGVRDLKYDVAINQQDPALSLELKAADLSSLRAAADRVKEEFATFDGVYDIADDMVAGKREFRLFVTPQAEALGITQAELARQVRQGFYGDEAQRIQRGRDDVKVMVRYPEDERRSIADLEEMRIRLPGGGEVPFSTVATMEEARGPAEINRADGRRTVTVTAEVDIAVGNANEIVGVLEKEGGFLEQLEAAFPGVDWSFEGEQREQAETMQDLVKGMALAVLIIFTLLSLVFASFLQPFIVLLAIPFGVVGALLGHMLMGLHLTMLSTIGILAMAGVVVNDSMILVDFVNRARAKGASAWEAVQQAGPRRFRPIILTSLTTFAGLTPLLLETSVQAQFLIPMAVSLSFGVLFSTFVILLIVPCSYLALHDVVALIRGGAGRTSSNSNRAAAVPGQGL